ncbi:MAG: DUF4340 domain-containing protein [Treponema sp.]|jgi:hypothetical protein|nr:DUF4340 domain-containing protein [Treponema sp.]
MTRKSKVLIAAFAALALLGGGYYGAVAWKQAKAEESSAGAAPGSSVSLSSLDSSKIIRIEIPGTGLFLEKQGDLWELSPPAAVRLDQGKIESALWSLGSLWAERVVEEEPGDLSVYGLDKTRPRTVVIDSEGGRADYLIGAMTPSRASYYVMTGEDPKVYAVSEYSVRNLLLDLDGIRDRSLLAPFEPQNLRRLILDTGKTRIDVSPKTEADTGVSSFSTFMLTSPYTRKQGVDGEKFGEFLAPLQSLQIRDFINDNPASLGPYGLDNPMRLYVETDVSSLDLFLGNAEGDAYYAKKADSPEVFTVGGLEAVVNARAFTIVDKFALILNIDTVDRFVISEDAKALLTAEIKGKGDEAVFTLNGRKTADKPFRAFYQTVIGLLTDAEYSGPRPSNNPRGVITIRYYLNTPPGQETAASLIPYNRDFYILDMDGTTEFLISRAQVQRIFDSADSMEYAEDQD